MKSEILFSALALITSVASGIAASYLYLREQRSSEQQYLATLWNNILDISQENPRFLDVNVTEGYKRAMTNDERVMYDIYCQKAWGHVQEIVQRGYHRQPRFQAAIQWLVTFHYEWLQDNPAFFMNEEFWRSIDRGKSQPAVILRHRQLPVQSDDQIDWDTVCDEYHNYVLSPFNPSMLTGFERGECRNLLVNELREMAAGGPIEIADFGCGIGNLLPCVADLNVRVVGVDLSKESLAIAQHRAEELGVEFEAIHADMTDLELGRTFGLIVSVNSLLPSTRREVHQMIQGIAKHLDHGGQFLGILPSYDTTEYLRNLWRARYLAVSGSEEHADRVARSLAQSKLSDPIDLKYADDGQTAQCYHTPMSIQSELSSNGLAPTGELQKVFYPWDLCRRFDYGWFPEAREEIWDWFVTARRM